MAAIVGALLASFGTNRKAFTISPAVSGLTTWDLETNGDLVLTTSTDYTITPLGSFTANVYAWGGGGGGAQTTGPGGGGGFAGGVATFSVSQAYTVLVAVADVQHLAVL